jgi:hypothetical protein
MTRVELRDEIVRLSESDPLARRRSRGWLGVARDLVASVMDAGLNLPGAAAAIRGESRPAEETTGPPPVATLTLAEIYLAQGHVDRALAVLDEVLAAEPEHPAARTLRERVLVQKERGGARRGVVQDAEVVEDIPLPPPAPAPFVVPPIMPPPIVPAPEPPPEPSVAMTEAPVAMAEPPVAAVEPPVAMAEPPGATSDSEPAPHSPESFLEPAPEAMMPSVRLPFERPRELPVSQPQPQPQPPSSSSDPAPEAVRVPEIMHVPEISPPTLAARASETAPAVEAPVGPPACVLAQGPSSVEGYYSLPPSTTGAVLRVAWFVPRHDGPTQGNLDVPLDPARGRVTLPELDRAACVRAALGVDAGAGFQPLAVAWVYRVADGRVSVEFAPPGAEPTSLRAQLV